MSSSVKVGLAEKSYSCRTSCTPVEAASVYLIHNLVYTNRIATLH